MHDPVGDAVDWVREGGLLAFPTETVWGLGVDSRSEGALRRLQHWKGRDASAPISILIADADCLDPLGFEPSDAAWHLIKNFWPGPLTLVLRCRGSFAPGVSRPDGAVGVRCSSHPVGARQVSTAAVLRRPARSPTRKPHVTPSPRVRSSSPSKAPSPEAISKVR